jgi:O-antigen ligase
MSRWSIQRLLRAAEVGYAIAGLFALTQGPVYRLWNESGQYQQFIALPTIGHAYFATFVAVQLPALCLVARRLSATFIAERRGQLLMALLLWLGLSVLWSTLARHSLPEFVSLFLTTSFGVYLAVCFRPAVFWRIVAGAMSLGLAISLIAILRDWEGAVNSEDGHWIGIYFNRNSLAPVAAVALLAAIGMLCTQPKWRSSGGLVVLVASVIITFGAVATLWRAESRTSPLALAAAVGVLAVWQLLRLLFERFWTSLSRYSAALATSISAVALFVALRLFGGLSTVSAELLTFNSRNGLWAQNWTGFLEKPFQGWGWMAARKTPSFFRQGVWWAAFETDWSHNGYHDLLLGGGVLAAMLFAGVVWFGMREIGSHASLSETIPSFLLVAFVLTAATQESFFIGTHFLWALLIAGLFFNASRNRPTVTS